jgi:DNA topoisomerase-1
MKDLSGGEESMDFKKYFKPEKCPVCGGKIILKNGKYGKFWACEKYPECKTTIPLLLNEVCPECGEHLVERRGKWGRSFTGCSGYPKCKYIKKAPKKEKKEA